VEQIEKHARERKLSCGDALVDLLDTGALAQRAAAALGEFGVSWKNCATPRDA
jgi:hypothetical protein